jgi:hypothetical protein
LNIGNDTDDKVFTENLLSSTESSFFENTTERIELQTLSETPLLVMNLMSSSMIAEKPKQL